MEGRAGRSAAGLTESSPSPVSSSLDDGTRPCALVLYSNTGDKWWPMAKFAGTQ
jgi:hypothetical protein